MKKVVFVYENLDFKRQIEYAVHILFQCYEVNLSIISEDEYKKNSIPCDILIYYGNDTEFLSAHIVIIPGKLFTKNYLKSTCIPDVVEYYNSLPIFFKDSNYDFFVRKKGTTLVFNIDIIQTIFFFLTCMEDYIIKDYDNYGRFKVEKSILYRYNLIDRPVVNESISFFISMINKNFKVDIKRKDLWNGKDFAVALTHDVDCFSKYFPFLLELRLILSIILVDKKPKEIPKRIKGYINTKILKRNEDPFSMDFLIDIEKKYNYKSSFYFMTDRSGAYNIFEKRIKKAFFKIEKSKSEIGFHPGLNTSNNEENFKSQIEVLFGVLGRKKVGARQHYLSFYSPNTWNIQSRNGILYDVSVCYPQVAGFKTGYCLPYRPYDLVENKILDLYEIPLILMDGSLFDYMKLDYEKSISYIKKLICEVKKYGGVFVTLWHNSAINSEYNIYSRDVFLWLYEYISKLNCFVDTGENIVKNYDGKA